MHKIITNGLTHFIFIGEVIIDDNSVLAVEKHKK